MAPPLQSRVSIAVVRGVRRGTMEILASIFAGLGLFFIGIRLIGNHLKQLAGRRMRALIARAVSGRGAVTLFGLAAGAIMQSVNAVTYVLVALVTAGAIENRRAFPVISWANIGTSMLVIVAALNLHLLALFLVGAIGIAFYLNLDQSARYRHAVGALLGVGLLFLGIDLIKSGSSILKQVDWLKDGMLYAAHYPVLSFAIGTGVALVAQSSSTITIVAMAMATAGLLSFEAGAMVVIGAGCGSALSAWALAGRLQGSARQLVLYQIVLKGLGVATLLLLFVIDQFEGQTLVVPLLAHLKLSPAAQLAAVYVVLQLASDLAMRVLNRPVLALIERCAPPSMAEVLGRPHYLQDGALAESESALLLVDKEQQRLLASLALYLDPLREEGKKETLLLDARYDAERNVMRECDQFLTEVADRNHSREVLEQTIVFRDRNALIASLQDSLFELASLAGSSSHAREVRGLIDNLVESLHMMLEVLAEAAASPEAEDLHLLRALTHDRSELMDGIRKRLQGGEADIAPDVQQAAFAATTLFERCVWLLRRYVLLLDTRTGAAAGQA